MKRGIRKRVFEILELAETGDLVSRICDVCLIGLIAANVLAVILETVPSLSQYSGFFSTFEVVSVAIFTAEYLARVWACISDERYRGNVRGRFRFIVSPMALVDLAAILPFYLPALLPVDLRVLRALRLLRLLRVLKFGRYSGALRSLGAVFRAKKEELVITSSVVFLLVVLASSAMYFVEHEAQPEMFSSIPASMWWAVATLTTVGYGDTYPVTVLGKVLGAVVAVLGIGMFALPAGILASGFGEELQRRTERRRTCPHCGKSLDVVPDSDSSPVREEQ